MKLRVKTSSRDLRGGGSLYLDVMAYPALYSPHISRRGLAWQIFVDIYSGIIYHFQQPFKIFLTFAMLGYIGPNAAYVM